MIEFLPVEGDERRFRAAMFRMAARAIKLAGGTLVGTRVKASPCFYPAPDLGVTIKALQTARSEIVARCALGHTIQVRVGA